MSVHSGPAVTAVPLPHQRPTGMEWPGERLSSCDPVAATYLHGFSSQYRPRAPAQCLGCILNITCLLYWFEWYRELFRFLLQSDFTDPSPLTDPSYG